MRAALAVALRWSLDPAKASLILKKFDKDKDGELGLEDMKGLMKKINKK